jgi:hypothetical protein
MIDDTLTTLAAKLDAALNSPAGVYTIVLNGSETDLTGFSPKTLNVTGNKNTTIILRGNGQTVQLGSTGSLLTLGAASGSSLALELRDITLQGRSGNNVPLVKVNTRGTLNMRIGSIITGNIISVTYASSWGSGVHVAFGGSFSMSGGAVSGNTASYSGGGVSVSNYASFSMSGGAVSDNTASYGGGVSVSRNFSMSGGAVSGNTSSYGGGGGGVCVGGGTFAMSGGAVSGNTLSGTNSYGREVLVRDGTFKMSGEARPERVFLYTNTRSITISGPLSGPVTPIDLGITSSAPLTGYVNKPILKLDTTYSAGNLAELKAFFVLGNSKYTASPWTETAISGYKISDGGLFVAE